MLVDIISSVCLKEHTLCLGIIQVEILRFALMSIRISASCEKDMLCIVEHEHVH
jgi:hypothetical protein